ncbi:MAG: ornithine carbamoyltransferase [Deltaproteobacteria bacterium]|nr:ornithine carbamoyltransferase [Deltaproteobacteria bacterium]
MKSKRDLLTLNDLGAEGILAVVHRAEALKQERIRGEKLSRPLEGKSVALIFEKPSTRTRVSFEVGVFELGAHPVVLNARDTQMGRGEPIEDTARVLSRYVHAIVLRTFADATMEALAKHATVPVINALTDGGHPCQILADLQTVLQRKGKLSGLKYAWVGDGNNVANSWIEACALLDLELTLAVPEGYEPSRPMDNVRIKLVRDPQQAVRDADVVITDVWASMGQEAESAKRAAAFAGYCITPELLSVSAPDVMVLHCLPAHRGEEIHEIYLDGPDAAVWDEAENRLHAQKALLEYLVR